MATNGSLPHRLPPLRPTPNGTAPPTITAVEEARRRQSLLSVSGYDASGGSKHEHQTYYRKWRRRNGLQWPPHPLQILGWIILLLVTLEMFGILIPALPLPIALACYAGFGMTFITHYIVHGIAVAVDPCDPELRTKPNIPVPEFDRSLHSHVIENGRCHLCNICIVSQRTKHCSICNKCVDRFDHHCKWLNQCIGKKNYTVFLLSVASAIIGVVGVFVLSVAELALYLSHKKDKGIGRFLNVREFFRYETTSNGTLLEEPSSFHVEFIIFGRFGMSDGSFLALSTITILLSAIVLVLLLHLCIFHMYIINLGLTTYEYIRGYHMTQQGPLEGAEIRRGSCDVSKSNKL